MKCFLRFVGAVRERPSLPVLCLLILLGGLLASSPYGGRANAGQLAGTIAARVPQLDAARGIATQARVRMSVPAPHEHFHLEAFDPHGNWVWTRDADNLVTTVGCNQIITDIFEASAFTAAWYIGLVKSASPTFATADTMASHSGWTEEGTTSTDLFPNSSCTASAAPYSCCTSSITGTCNTPTAVTTGPVRPTLTLGSVSGGSASNSGAVATFVMNSTITLYGAYVVDNSTPGGTTGNLYGEATFTAAPVAAGYSVQVTLTMAATAG